MRNEVLSSLNALTQVHKIFESQDLSKEPSLISTNVNSVTQTQAINSTMPNDTNELKEMILNLQKQINALQNNTKQTNSKQTNSKRVTLQQDTFQGNCRRFNTSN